ncbi:MAG TPA: cupin domain-containing protein [Xanthobacteraceae bacterium]|nr:cupin domain-containing protein [Xanthobacteraceae bacterium]
MSTALGTLEELPRQYREDMDAVQVAPLWPQMRTVMPYGEPAPVTKPCLWAIDQIRPLLLRAGELTPVEKAERRVLMLCDPGRGKGAMQATGSIYCGLQLLLPGEKAPAHRHTPSAARIVVEGQGAYTIVNGEKCIMQHGDLILTPTGAWHDHGHDGSEPVIWLDALDLPVFMFLEGSYGEEAELQAPANRPDSSEVEYAQAGLIPSRAYRDPYPRYPLMRYPWGRTEEGLRKLAEYTPLTEPVEMHYVNPTSGMPPLPTLGFTAMMLRPGEAGRPPIRSASAVFHVVKGAGASTINGTRFEWKQGDTFSAPVFARIEHAAERSEPAFLIRIHDAPLQHKLGYYEERPRA